MLYSSRCFLLHLVPQVKSCPLLGKSQAVGTPGSQFSSPGSLCRWGRSDRAWRWIYRSVFFVTSKWMRTSLLPIHPSSLFPTSFHPDQFLTQILERKARLKVEKVRIRARYCPRLSDNFWKNVFFLWFFFFFGGSLHPFNLKTPTQIMRVKTPTWPFQP